MTRESTEEEVRDGTFIERVLRHSQVAGLLRTASSGIGARLRRGEAYLEGSRLYRWLTKEPEPDIVVVDLRETVTLGWLVRLLDECVDTVRPYWEESSLKRLAAATVAATTRFSRTQIGRGVSVLLTSPDPPNQDGNGEGSAREDGDASRADGLDDERDS